MKLRVTFLSRQLLSAVSAIALLLAAQTAPLFAQAPAAGTDAVTLATNPPQRKAGVLITGVRGGKIMIREGAGEIGYSPAQIASIEKAAPAEYVQAQRLIEAGDFEKAAPLMAAVVGNFKGLATQWAQDATSSLGNVYLALGELSKAEAAFSDFKSSYGGSDSPATKVGEARLAAAKKQFSAARAAAQPIVEGVLSKKNITRAESRIFGQAFFVLGQCDEGENKLPEAMKNYATTVAIFYQERAIVAEAQKRIDELRKKGVTTP